MLCVMYHYQTWALNSVGVAPLDVAVVENVNLSTVNGGTWSTKARLVS